LFRAAQCQSARIIAITQLRFGVIRAQCKTTQTGQWHAKQQIQMAANALFTDFHQMGKSIAIIFVQLKHQM